MADMAGPLHGRHPGDRELPTFTLRILQLPQPSLDFRWALRCRSVLAPFRASIPGAFFALLGVSMALPESLWKPLAPGR